MQTRCPSCETIFRLPEEQSNATSGVMQCGICHHYFDAFAARIDKPDRRSSAHAIKDVLVEKSRELAARDLFTSLKGAYVHAPSGTSWWATTLWSVLILLCLTAMLAQLAWFYRMPLSDREELRPYVLMACERLPCDLRERSDRTQIELLSRDVRSHPAIQGVLLITATFINHADFEQPYPRVGLQLLNLTGEVVAYRHFEPVEYLNRGYQEPALMDIDVPVTMIMEVVDPGRETVSYRFDFL